MFPVSLSILASFMSAVTILGTATEMYRFGTQYMVIILSYFIVIPSAAYLYMPIFYRLEVTSAYEVRNIPFHSLYLLLHGVFVTESQEEYPYIHGCFAVRGLLPIMKLLCYCSTLRDVSVRRAALWQLSSSHYKW